MAKGLWLTKPNTQYIAPAVQFDSNTYLARGATLTGAVDTSKCLFSVWINAILNAGGNASIASSFPNDSWNPYVDFGTDRLEYQLADATFTDFIAPLSASPVVDAGWQNYLISVDVSQNDPDKVVQLLLNGSPSLDYTPGAVPGFVLPFSTETDYFVGWDGYAPVNSKFAGGMADLQLWIGINPDLTDSSNVEKFISAGKPVNPSVATAEFGQPILLFSGDATGFQTNQGTGGTFTTTGTLTNASTSPSD